jgi:alkanesulfonate monooxygenase SsuD/methylene tetrahydromethanopterin reductase-like flavin-dependent oxidoreductase (luciferase family)
MRVGIGPLCQNAPDMDRFEAHERGEEVGEMRVPDSRVWREHLYLCDLAEPLGYDSLWTFEHRADPYIMLPAPMMFLAWMAGRTRQIDFGTMVVVLPWHDPLRLAEELAVLTHFLGSDRKLKLGFGRGLARREFKALGIPMEDARGLLAEGLEVIRLALRNEFFSFDGEHFHYDDVMIRPRPLDSSIIDDAYLAWGSPPSIRTAAELGLNALANPTRRLFDIQQEMAHYHAIRREYDHPPAARPVVQAPLFCRESEQEARELVEQYGAEYADAALRHYEYGGAHLDTTKGYEHYNATPLNADARQNLVDIFVEEGVWGTPGQCIERIEAINEMLGPAELTFWFNPGTMPVEEAEKTLRLFAEQALPTVHRLESKDVHYPDPVAAEE